jgi:hypothetical protein
MRSGIIGAGVRPNWREPSTRGGLRNLSLQDRPPWGFVATCDDALRRERSGAEGLDCIEKAYAAFSLVDSLFRRFAVEVFVVGLRVAAGMVDDAVPKIRWRIERIELQWNFAGIDVVIGSSRDNYRESRSDRRPNAIENRLTGPLLDAKELVELVDLRPDLFLGL